MSAARIRDCGGHYAVGGELNGTGLITVTGLSAFSGGTHSGAV